MRGDDGEAARATPRWLAPVLLVIVALAILVPALAVRYGPVVVATPHHRAIALPHRRVVPPAEVPPVEPVAFVQLDPEDARAFNASVPFVAGPIPPARPFTFAGAADDRARAVDCLAAAVIYEAGDDTTGERAVAQVIVNRLRHPAFPKTVCGVVFEGAERTTGCQFTFTCDGAMTRWSPSPAGWARAQAVAAAALNGKVDKPVGWATHYHTDWVVPYWQSSLDKIAAVGTHLFFRWTGWWGTGGAFRSPGTRPEPAIAAMARLSDAHRAASGLTDEEIAAAAASGVEAETAAGEAPPSVNTDPDSFLVTLRPTTAPAFYPQIAETACGARPRCVFSAWRDAKVTPSALPLSPQQVASMSFSYYRDRAAGLERTLWNCQQTPRPDKHQCMKQQQLFTAFPVPGPAAAPAPAPSPTPKGPTELDGVRRKATATAPAPKPGAADRAPAELEVRRKPAVAGPPAPKASPTPTAVP